jgi:hypothetical protein
MVHNSKARIKVLEDWLYANVIGHRSAFEVSDVKQDGSVFIRFRGIHIWSSMELARMCGKELLQAGKTYVQTDDNKLRLALDQFGSV